jgi:hypothetical protein
VYLQKDKGIWRLQMTCNDRMASPIASPMAYLLLFNHFTLLTSIFLSPLASKVFFYIPNEFLEARHRYLNPSPFVRLRTYRPKSTTSNFLRKLIGPVMRLNSISFSA